MVEAVVNDGRFLCVVHTDRLWWFAIRVKVMLFEGEKSVQGVN